MSSGQDKTMSTLVSVVIPCFNVGQYMKECLASVMSQTHTPLQVICIDNNSSDDTWEVLQELKQSWPGLVVEKELKAGANAARNKGLSLATGEWVQFLDADDLLEPAKLEHQLELISRSGSGIAFVAAACKRRSLNGKDTIDHAIEHNRFLAAFINKSGITSANLWHAEQLRNITGWNEGIKSSQEADLMLRLILAGGKYIVDEVPLTIIRERESGQISTKAPGQNWIRYIDVRLNFLSELKKTEYSAYLSHEGIYQDSLMVSVLALSRYNPEKALDYYNTFIRGKWHSANKFGMNKLKVTAISLLGLGFYIRLMNIRHKFDREDKIRKSTKL